MSDLIRMAKKFRKQIEEAIEYVPREKAEEYSHLHKKWSAYDEFGEPVSYDTIGMRRQHNGVLYSLKIPHISQDNFAPDLAPSLWDRVSDNSGTEEDVIPYGPGMILEEGKYYSENEIIYICTRDSGIAVYNDLKDLVDIYVKVK